MNVETQSIPAVRWVFNRRPRWITFYKPKAIVEVDGTKDMTPPEAVTFKPGLAPVSVDDFKALGLDSKDTPHVGDSLRIVERLIDLGEGDAITAARATGDVRVLRWMDKEIGHTSMALRLAIASRIVEIEGGKPIPASRRTVDTDEGEDEIDLGEA